MTYMYTTPRVPGGSARAIAGKDRSTRRFGTALVASLAGAFLLSAAIAGAANAQEDRFFSVEHSNTAQVAGSGGVPGATITAYDAETTRTALTLSASSRRPLKEAPPSGSRCLPRRRRRQDPYRSFLHMTLCCHRRSTIFPLRASAAMRRPMNTFSFRRPVVAR